MLAAQQSEIIEEENDTIVKPALSENDNQSETKANDADPELLSVTSLEDGKNQDWLEAILEVLIKCHFRKHSKRNHVSTLCILPPAR